jgi:hypothetical protein
MNDDRTERTDELSQTQGGLRPRGRRPRLESFIPRPRRRPDGYTY